MTLLLFWSLLWLGGCDRPPPPELSGPPAGGDTDPDQTDGEIDGGADSGETGGAPPGVALPDSCEPPPIDGHPALRREGEIQYTEGSPESDPEWFMELLDLEIDVVNQRVLAAGQGGVVAFDVSDPGEPRRLGYYPPVEDGQIGRYYRLERDGDRIYAAHRDRGLAVIDASEPSAMTGHEAVEALGLEGMALVGERLYGAGLWGELFTFDVSDPDEPALIETTGGLGTAWDVVVDGAVAYVADSALGVVVIDLTDPDRPAVVGAVDVGGGVQDLALDQGVIYAAAGGAGIAVLDRSEPLAPVWVAGLDYGSSVQSVALDGTVLWAVNQEDVIAVDVTDPRSPVPIGTAETPEHAMHVAAADGLAYVGDWTRLSLWMLDPGEAAPDLELEVSELYIREEPETFEILLRNTGGVTLTLAGATVDDARFGVTASGEHLAPGEEGALYLDFDGGSGEVDATLCLASDDPDLSQATVALHSGDGGSHEAIGEEAPDFTLQSLDGQTYQLSQERGRPVLLVFFATW